LNMNRVAVFLAVFVSPVLALGQVPPGNPYDSAKHPNPIVTYVTNQDFKPSTSSEVQKLAGRELLGLSQEEGRQESIEIAILPSTTRRVKIGRSTVDVVYYSVVRQTFTVRDGGRLVLHSFKFPRLPVPLN